MKSWFLERGYDEKMLDRQVNLAKRRTRHLALYSEPIRRSKEGCLPLVLDFHPAFSGISSISTELQPILSNCSTTKEIFCDKPFIFYR